MSRATEGRSHSSSSGSGAASRALGGLALLALLAGLAYPVVLALRGATLDRVFVTHVGLTHVDHVEGRHWVTVWLVLALVAAVALAGLWWRAEVRAARGRGELEDRLADAEAERDQQRARAELQDRARRVEHDWNRRLRSEIADLHRERGGVGDSEEVGALVLRVAVNLLHAEKGLLLEPAPGEGRLRVAAAQGFDHDPSASQLAQRLADQGLRQDRIVRENDIPSSDPDRRSPADAEVRNLVAIPLYLRDELTGAIVCANRDGGFDDHDDDVLLALGDHSGAVLENQRLNGQLRGSYLATVRVLADAIEAKDRLLGGHCLEVSQQVEGLARRLELEGRARDDLIFASLLHDVGKIGISERILLKPGRLTDAEYTVIKEHPTIGHRLISRVPELERIGRAVLHHHERFDGGGYPAGLRGEAIPLGARIIAVVDAFHAMTSARPYAAAMPIDEACAELERSAGSQFDPEVVRLFVDEVHRVPPPQRAPDPLTVALLTPHAAAPPDAGIPVLGLPEQAEIDALTGLWSRRHLHELLATEVVRADLDGTPVAVVLTELADLARRNGDGGYGAGDALIHEASAALGQVAEAAGGVACRYSGGRLALVVPGAGETAAAAWATAVTDAVGPHVPVRVAWASWAPGDGPGEILGRARSALRAVITG